MQPGLVLSPVITNTNMEMTFVKEGGYTQRSIQTGDMTMEPPAGPLGEALRRQGVRVKHGPRPSHGFQGKE